MEDKKKEASQAPECIKCEHILDCRFKPGEVKNCINYEERNKNGTDERH